MGGASALLVCVCVWLECVVLVCGVCMWCVACVVCHLCPLDFGSAAVNDVYNTLFALVCVFVSLVRPAHTYHECHSMVTITWRV